MTERHEIAFQLRTGGASFREIGEALGVGPQRASVIYREAERKMARKIEAALREEAIKVLLQWASTVRSWKAFRPQVRAIHVLFADHSVIIDDLECPCGKDPDDCPIHADAQG
jgi:hypothetical protein